MPVIDAHVYLEGYTIPGVNQNAQQVAQHLRDRGIERAILLSARAARVDPLSGNRILNAMIEQDSGLYGCLTANLSRVDVSVQSIRDLLGQKKFVAILLTTPGPRAPLNPLVADEILNACRRYQKPIYIYTPNAACVQVALQLARTYNTHKFVFLGMGGVEWRTAIAAGLQATNVFLETSGPLDRAKIPAAAEALGAHRVIFGSGCPYLDPAAGIALVEESDLPEQAQQIILFDNAARLFGLENGES